MGDILNIKPKPLRKTKRISVRVSPDEYKRIGKISRYYRMEFSDFCRGALLNTYNPKQFPKRIANELHDAFHLLTEIKKNRQQSFNKENEFLQLNLKLASKIRAYRNYVSIIKIFGFNPSKVKPVVRLEKEINEDTMKLIRLQKEMKELWKGYTSKLKLLE